MLVSSLFVKWVILRGWYIYVNRKCIIDYIGW